MPCSAIFFYPEYISFLYHIRAVDVFTNLNILLVRLVFLPPPPPPRKVSLFIKCENLKKISIP